MTDRNLPKILDVDDCKAILGQFDRDLDSHHKNRAMIWLMLAGGLRVSEVSDLTLDRINLNTGRIDVRDSKGGAGRTVYVQNADALQAVRTWIEVRPTEDDEGQPVDVLFPTRTGGRTTPRSIRRTVKRYARKAEVQGADEVSPHTFRHTCLTRLYQQTRDIHLVQRFAGHADPSTTEVYVHLAADDVREQTVNFDPLADEGTNRAADSPAPAPAE